MANFLGYPDAMTFALSSVVVLVRNSISRFAFAWLLAVNHFEQGLVIILTLIPLLAWREKLPLSAALWPLGVGFAVGKISLETYFALCAFHIRFTRVDYFFHNAREIITFDGVRPVSLYSFMNVFWLFALPALTWARKNRPPLFRRCALLLLADMAIAGFLTFDKMRVFALISWPVLLVPVLETCGKVRRAGRFRLLIHACFFLSLLLPRVLVWRITYGSLLPYDILFISDTLGWSNFLGGRSDWPLLMLPFR